MIEPIAFLVHLVTQTAGTQSLNQQRAEPACQASCAQRLKLIRFRAQLEVQAHLLQLHAPFALQESMPASGQAKRAMNAQQDLCSLQQMQVNVKLALKENINHSLGRESASVAQAEALQQRNPEQKQNPIVSATKAISESHPRSVYNVKTTT